MHDPITYKVFSPHVHIVFLKNTGNVFDMNSLQLLAIKPKTWRDLVSDEPFERKDIITIQDPKNLVTRDLRDYDYVKKDKKVTGGCLLVLLRQANSDGLCAILHSATRGRYMETGADDHVDDDLKGDPLRGINVDAAGGASKVLKMIAQKVGCAAELSRSSVWSDPLSIDPI